jgi:hypothetical protein
MIAHVRVVHHHRQPQPRKQRPRTRLPDSCSTCGELIAPPDRITSARARITRTTPLCRTSTPTARPALDHHARHLRMGHHRQVRPPHRRPQERPRGRVPPPPLHRQLIGPHPLLLRPVEIRHRPQPGSLPGRDEAAHQRMQVAPVGRDEQRPARPAPRVLPGFGILHRAVSRQNLVPAPAGVPRRRPVVVIAPVPPDIDHRIDRGRSPQHLPPRPVVPLPRQPRIGLRPVQPVHRRVVEQLAVSQRQLHIEPPVRPPASITSTRNRPSA